MRFTMQAPILVFDHVRKIALVMPTGPGAENKLAELAAAQRKQVATSGVPSK
jgi:hypothetical protein